MPIFFDHDPLTGVTETFDYDPVMDRMAISYSQDVSHMLDRMNAIRNNPDIWKDGVKNSWALYAQLPTVVQMELINKGFKLDGKDDTKKLFKEINQNYPFLKATDKVIK